jgi:hypothetical protein
MATLSGLEIEGMSVDQVYGEILKRGVTQAEASIIVGEWIIHNVGRTKRTFEFATAFPAVEAGCVSAFARAFEHVHWIDGQSVVQAEKTSVEAGFNERFDNIKTDITNLAAEIAKAFACLAAMRADLRTMLDEVRTELNRLNADVYACCSSGEGRVELPGPSNYQFFDRNRFRGTTTFFGKDVSVWDSDGRLILLPITRGPIGDPMDDPRIKRPATFARLIEEAPEVRQIFAGGGVTKERFIQALGAMRTPDGVAVADLVKILPDNQPFASPEAMLAAASEREAASLRTSGDVKAVVTAALGADVEPAAAAKAPVADFDAIPTSARTALVANGVDTIEKLAAVNARDLAGRLGRAGVAASAGDVAGWSAMAKTLSKLSG